MNTVLKDPSPAEVEQITAIVVDDSPSFLDVFCRYFSEEPGALIVGTANNGFEAINMVLRLHPRLVVMDYHMPGLSGDKAANWIAEHFPEIRVLLVSSDEHPEVISSDRPTAFPFICKNDLMAELPPLLADWFSRPAILSRGE